MLRAGVRRSYRKLGDGQGLGGLGAGKFSLVGSLAVALTFEANVGLAIPLPPEAEVGDLIIACAVGVSTNLPQPRLDRAASDYNSGSGVAMSAGGGVYRAGVDFMFSTNTAGTHVIAVFAVRAFTGLIDIAVQAAAPVLYSAAQAFLRRSMLAVHAQEGGSPTSVSTASANVKALGRILGPRSWTFDLFKLEDIPLASAAVNHAYVYGTAPARRAAASFTLVGVQEPSA